MGHCKSIKYGWIYAFEIDEEEEKIKNFYNTTNAIESYLGDNNHQHSIEEHLEHDT